LDELDNQYPEYQFRKNKGYPSPSHIVAIKEFGYSNIHRKSFVVKSLVL
jgi:ribonuclease HII